MENNTIKNGFHWLYMLGFFGILTLPILVIPPWFYPPDWGKSIIFRSVLAILLFLFLWQFFYRRNEITPPSFKNNKVLWALGALFTVFLLASIFSVDPFFSFWGSPHRGDGFTTFIFYFVFASLTSILLKKEDWKKTWIFSIAIGILASLIGIIQYYGLFNKIFLSIPDRPPSTMGNPDFLATYLLLLFFITLSFFIKKTPSENIHYPDQKQNKYLKIFYLLSCLLFLYTILITESRAAYLGLTIGLIYFFLFLPKKTTALKIGAVTFLIIVCSLAVYINTFARFPQLLENNKLFKSIDSRLSIKLLAEDPRFAAWKIELNILKSKPLLGYGPENFAVGFDKYYDPSIPYLNADIGWWDRAHNILFDIGSQAGILGIIAYLSLFIVSLWQLQKLKNNQRKITAGNGNPWIIPHGIQAALIGYFITNFFGFDSSATYLIFFFIIGYSLYLTYSDYNKKSHSPYKKIKGRGIIICASSLILIIFLWQYNFIPLQVNSQINISNNLTSLKQCDQALNIMNKILPKHSFLDSYLRMKYVNNIKSCASVNPEKKLEYVKLGEGLLKEAIKIQPLYTRYWIALGNFTTIIASNEQNHAKKASIIKEASFYLDQAEKLSPLRAEIFLEKIKTEMISGDYSAMKTEANKCIAINPPLRDCYWARSLAEIYLKDFEKAKADTKIAQNMGFNTASIQSLNDLASAYATIQDYSKLIQIYQRLIAVNPDIPDYHLYLATAYAKISEYKKARDQALMYLSLRPEAKDKTDAFLKTLPY